MTTPKTAEEFAGQLFYTGTARDRKRFSEVIREAMTQEYERGVRAAAGEVAKEPNLPGDMPDEMWQAIQGNRELVQQGMRISVQQTKANCINRILALLQ